MMTAKAPRPRTGSTYSRGTQPPMFLPEKVGMRLTISSATSTT